MCAEITELGLLDRARLRCHEYQNQAESLTS